MPGFTRHGVEEGHGGRPEATGHDVAPFAPPTGFFDCHEYGGVQLLWRGQIRVNDYEKQWKERARLPQPGELDAPRPMRRPLRAARARRALL